MGDDEHEGAEAEGDDPGISVDEAPAEDFEADEVEASGEELEPEGEDPGRFEWKKDDSDPSDRD